MFSLIVPTLFKNKNFIIDNLSKVANYNLNLEIIIIFQNITEKEFQMNSKSFLKFKKIKTYNIEKVGISAARNFGIQQSLYPWILLMDDDLIIEEGTLFQLSTNLSSKHHFFYYCNTLVINSNYHFLKFQATSKFLGYFNFHRISSVSLIIHKSIFNQIGLFNEKIGAGKYYGSSEETDLIYRAFKSKIKIVYLKNINFFHPKAIMDRKKSIDYARGFGMFIKLNYAKASLKWKLIFFYLIIFRTILIFYPKPNNFSYLLALFKVLSSNQNENL